MSFLMLRVISLWLSCAPLLAQSPVEVKGWTVTIVDEIWAAIAGARTFLRLSDSTIVFEAKTNATGTASFDFDWQPGLEVWVDARGFYLSRILFAVVPSEAMMIRLENAGVVEGAPVIGPRRSSVWLSLRRFFGLRR